MKFVKCITFLTLLKVVHPHIEGFGRSKIIKNPDGTIKKIIYSSIEEYFAMAIFEQIKDSPKVSDEKVHIHNTTVFENHRKSLIPHFEQSKLCLHFEWTKVNQRCPKRSILASFWKPEACGQTVLPDKSI